MFESRIEETSETRGRSTERKNEVEEEERMK